MNNASSSPVIAVMWGMVYVPSEGEQAMLLASGSREMAVTK
jgi:hypothetical protein